MAQESEHLKDEKNPRPLDEDDITLLKTYHGKDNAFRCTYVLPDGVTHTQGYVKDPEEAKRYLAVGDGDSVEQVAKKMEVDRVQVTDKVEERKKIDLSKNEFDLTNERFLVPEMIFHPTDLGMNQAGLAECTV